MRVPLQHLNRSMQSLHNRGLQIHGVAIDREGLQSMAPTDAAAEATTKTKPAAQEKHSGQKSKRNNRRKRG